MPEKGSILRWIYLAVLAAMWGSSFILMKRGLLYFTPDQVAALRMFISFIALFPFIAASLKHIDKKLWKYIVATGLLGNGIPAFLFTHAETGISGSMAGMLNSLTSVFTLILGFLFFGTMFTARHVVGVILGFTGAAFLIYLSSGDAQSTEPWKGVYVLIATVFYAISVNILRNKLSGIPAITLTGAALLVAGLPCGIFLFSTDFVSRLTTVPGAWQGVGFVVTLAIFGTVISTVLFNQLIRISSALYASSVTYLIPFVAVLWGLYDAETFNGFYLLALLIILLGIYLINVKPKQAKL